MKVLILLVVESIYKAFRRSKLLEFNTPYGGRVTGTTPFVFVEFNDCLTGMIHKANVVEEWQNRISEIKPGN
jgi:hypothetical protein